MGVQTLAGFRTELSLILKRRDDFSTTDPSNGQTDLDRWINFAYRHVTNKKVFKHPTLDTSQDITLLADTSDYALSSDLFSIDLVEIIDTSRKTVTFRKNFRILKNDQFRSPQGIIRARPKFYTRRNQRIFFNCSPDTTTLALSGFARVWYYAKPALLAADDDVTVIDEVFDEIITHRSAASAWASLGQESRSDYHREYAVSLLNDLAEPEDEDALDPGLGFEPDTQTTSSSYVET